MFIQTLINIFLHLDVYLGAIIEQYGLLVYTILFLVIFVETGLVIMPFLPGDSLLFAVGTFSALGNINLPIILVLLIVAAILGDTLNYWVGHHMGRRVFHEKSRIFKKEYLMETEKFYEKHGGKTIILARFMPIIRTFAPFVAGVGHMKYSTFLLYNIVGGIAWVTIFVLGGYFFGNIPAVKENFELVIIAIIVLSIIPAIIHAISSRMKKRKALVKI